MNVRDRYRLEFRAEAKQRIEKLLRLLDTPGAETFETLHRETHGIKGTAAMFGETKASALAGALEERSKIIEAAGTISDNDKALVLAGLNALFDRVQGNDGDDSAIIAALRVS